MTAGLENRTVQAAIAIRAVVALEAMDTIWAEPEGETWLSIGTEDAASSLARESLLLVVENGCADCGQFESLVPARMWDWLLDIEEVGLTKQGGLPVKVLQPHLR